MSKGVSCQGGKGLPSDCIPTTSSFEGIGEFDDASVGRCRSQSQLLEPVPDDMDSLKHLLGHFEMPRHPDLLVHQDRFGEELPRAVLITRLATV